MRENSVINFFVGIIVLYYLLVDIHMVYGDAIKDKKFNHCRELSFTQQSSLIIGICYSEREDTEKSIRIWSVEDGNLSNAIPVELQRFPNYSSVHQMAISRDDNLMAVSFSTKAVGCYSLKEKKWLWKAHWLEEEDNGPQDIAFTPDNQRVITVGEKNTVIYDVKIGNILERQTEPLSDYRRFGSATTGATLSSSGRYLVAWQRLPTPGHEVLIKLFMNKKVTVWDIEENKLIARWKKPEQNLCNAIFTPDEKHIAFGFGESFGSEYVKIWSIPEQKMIREWKAHKEGIDYLTISPDGRFLATFGYYNIVKIWEYSTEKILYEFDDVGDVSLSCEGSHAMAFSPDSKYFALEKNGQLCLYETETWREKWCVPSYPDDKQASKAD